MASNILDLLSPTVRDLRREEADERNEEFRFAQLTPDQQISYLAYKGGRGIGRGLGQAAGAVLGVDTRSENERYADAIRRVKEQIAAEGVDPTDLDKFYGRVIQLLGQHGLVAEAAAMNREYRRLKAEEERGQLSLRREKRLEEAEQTRARQADERNAIAREALGTKAPAILQIIKAAEDPNISPERRKLLLEAANAQSGGKVEWVNAGDRIVAVRRDQILGPEIQRGVSPDAALADRRARDLAAAKQQDTAQRSDADLTGASKTKLEGYTGFMAQIQKAYRLLLEYPKAVGWKNYLSVLKMRDWMDPAGVTVRAEVNNVGSYLTSLRSGAAVSAAEFERLEPFIPDVKDSYRAIISKLTVLYENAGDMANAIRAVNNVPLVDYPPLPEFSLRDLPKAEPKKAPTPQQPSKEVQMRDRAGKLYWVHPDDVEEAKRQGWKEVQ